MPRDVPDEPYKGLLLGQTVDQGVAAVGFGRTLKQELNSGCVDIHYSGDAPLITLSPTGGGKTSGPVVTNLRTYPGQVICLDVKGEAHRLSADHRRAMGQKVHVIDMRDGRPEGDSLNPLDTATFLGTDLIAIARSMAAEIVTRPTDAGRDFFWVDWSETMTAAGISMLLHHMPNECRLSKLFDIYANDDVNYGLAVHLDKTNPMNRATHAAWVSYLALPSEMTRLASYRRPSPICGSSTRTWCGESPTGRPSTCKRSFGAIRSASTSSSRRIG